MRLPALFLLAVVFGSSAMLSARAAIIDENGNGLNDVWELVYQAGDLNPVADDDGDGFNNYQEAASGTDPRDPGSHPPALAVSAAGGALDLSWSAVRGKQYRLQTGDSPNGPWTYTGVPFYGAGTNLSVSVGIDPARPKYYRVQIGDVDSDGDGVSDWEEIQLGYDPFQTDSFNSGLGDRQAIMTALSAASVISLRVERGTASAAYGDTGLLRFTRAGGVDPVTVAYTVGGTAASGADYLPLSGVVRFPLGVNTADVNVTPMPGATFAANRTVVVTLAAGAGYSVGPDAAGGVVTIVAQPAAAGQIVAESWDNVNGYNLTFVPFRNTPDRRAILNSLEAPSNTGIYQYGSRLRGYLTAPASGAYTFWIASDDDSEFRLSTDEQMANLALRAGVDGYTNSRQWNKYPSQKSLPVTLVAGQRYAFECKLFQGYGGDNLAVGWQRPGQTPIEVIPGAVLSAYVAPYSPPGVTTLYFGALDRSASAPANATGFASVRLTSDETTGILHVAQSSLSGPPTSLALRGPAEPGQTGPVIAEFAGATAQADGTFLWKISDPAAVAALKTGRVYASVATAANPGGELAGRLLRSTGAVNFTPPPAPPALPAAVPTAGDAARLLTQATFGATNADIAAVQRDGYAAWIDAQLAAPATLTLPFFNNLTASGGSVTTNTFQESWWRNALSAPDQLRQRVAFALSEILVISDVDGVLGNSPASLASYYDTLLRDAFGTFRTLLEDVTLHPAMGTYLNMLHNDRANPDTGAVPNENYGREVMQLFTVGLHKLNPDGSLLLDAQSRPIATYGQDEVKGFSYCFTGWTYAQNGAGNWDYVTANFRQPMALVPSHHDPSAKPLLDGVTLPAGQSGEQDLKDALDLLANHPNTGPFICRQLIQKLVTSNPSPGYIYRVAQKFADNGQGQRGDLRAVLRAILLDYEARSATTFADPEFGKVREPIIRLANMYRAFGGRAYNGRYDINQYDIAPSYGQAPLDAPSVFNFFPPTFTRSGEIAAAGLVCPEFGITTATTVVFSSNNLRARAALGISSANPSQMGVNLSALQALAGNPGALVDSLNPLLLNGQMSAGLRQQTINAVTGVDPANSLRRAQTAVQILCTSPEFCIQK